MGVIRFFRWIVKTYPLSYNIINPSKTISNVSSRRENQPDVFLIDANALFHPCCTEIFTGGSLLRPNQSSFEELKGHAFKRIVEKILELIKISNPRKTVYIGIDGVAGCAKQAQQRRRRFKAAQERDPSSIWDSSHLTAGTDFMIELCAYIKKYFIDNPFKYLTILIDDIFNVGEGEHKLIKYIKYCNIGGQKPVSINSKNTSNMLKNQMRRSIYNSYCIYSPDADLIMLTIGLDIGNITILRENIYYDMKGEYFVVDIDKLKEGFYNTFVMLSMEGGSKPVQEILTQIEKYDKSRVLNDIVLFFFMLGNDFLPHVPCIDIHYDGIIILFKMYVNSIIESDMFLVGQNGTPSANMLNVVSYTILLKKMSELEPSLLLKRYVETKTKYPDTVLNGSCTKSEIDMKKYRRNYYLRNFKIDVDIDYNPSACGFPTPLN